MKAKDVKNIAASQRAKLLNRSRERKEDFQFLLGRWVAERFLHRLGISPQRDRFALKGATIFLVWNGESARPTRDLDLLGFGVPDIGDIVQTFRDICSLPAADGIEFELDSIRDEPIREAAGYDGIRVHTPATLDNARLSLRIDIGFGDVVDPAPVDAQLPVILDLPAPFLRPYANGDWQWLSVTGWKPE